MKRHQLTSKQVGSRGKAIGVTLLIILALFCLAAYRNSLPSSSEEDDGWGAVAETNNERRRLSGLSDNNNNNNNEAGGLLNRAKQLQAKVQRYRSQEDLEELGGRLEETMLENDEDSQDRSQERRKRSRKGQAEEEEKEEKYDEEEDDGKLTLHIIAHTHLDPGWLETFGQYHERFVVSIISSMLTALEKNPQRRFSWVEICFLSRWWEGASSHDQQRLRQLWRRGQLEFVMGGMVSNDEACVNYMQAINQLTEGHRWLQQHIDPQVVPTVGWQIDPFGLSVAMAYLFTASGFEAHAGWRISEPEMRHLVDRQQMEFIWQPLKEHAPQAQLLMHLLPYSYTCPPEYLFETKCPSAISCSSAQSIAASEIKNLAHQLESQVMGRATHLNHGGHLMWLWGHDFHFKQATYMFDVMDRVVEAINQNPHSRVKAIYSTPNRYFDALQRRQYPFPRFSGRDFMPYQAGPVNWWSGYFTSRPHLKRSLRILDNVLRSSEQLLLFQTLQSILSSSSESAASSFSPSQQLLTLFRKVEHARYDNAVMQHHDAITGTMRMAVLDDYYQMLQASISSCLDVIAQTTYALLQSSSSPSSALAPLFSPSSSPQLLSPLLPPPRYGGDHAISIGTDGSKRICFYNSMPSSFGRVLSVRLAEKPRSQLIVRDDSGQEIPSEVYTSFAARAVNAPTHALLLFTALPPLSLACFTVELSTKPLPPANIIDSAFSTAGLIPSLSNEHLTVSFQGKDRKIDLRRLSITSPTGSYRAKHEFLFYPSDDGWANQYTFKASRDASEVGSYSQWYLIQGQLRQELYVTVEQQNIKRRYILDRGAQYVQVVDEVDPPTFTGRDYVSRWSLSGWDTSSKVWTDANGLLPVERTHQPATMISGNYWPSVYVSELHNHQGEIFLSAADVSEGVGAPENGCLERMLHRVAMQSMGNGEKMNEGGWVAITSRIAVGPQQLMADLRHRMTMDLNFPPLVIDPKGHPLRASYQLFDAFSLPPSLFLTTLQLHNTSHLLIRILHHGEPARPVRFDLLSLFTHNRQGVIRASHITETTLTAARPLSTTQPHQWDVASEHHFASSSSFSSSSSSSSSCISNDCWHPFQIRTFLISLNAFQF